MLRFIPAGGLMLALVLAACAGGMPAEGDATPPSTPARSEPTDDPLMPPGGEFDELVAQVVAEAARGAGVGEDEVNIVSAGEVTWSDGSLGCPEPGMGYTQALVPGYRVVVEIDGEELHFHASQAGDFRYCADPQPPLDAGDS